MCPPLLLSRQPKPTCLAVVMDYRNAGILLRILITDWQLYNTKFQFCNNFLKAKNAGIFFVKGDGWEQIK
jgi:hypothetical protein